MASLTMLVCKGPGQNWETASISTVACNTQRQISELQRSGDVRRPRKCDCRIQSCCGQSFSGWSSLHGCLQMSNFMHFGHPSCREWKHHEAVQRQTLVSLPWQNICGSTFWTRSSMSYLQIGCQVWGQFHWVSQLMPPIALKGHIGHTRGC